jgi:hypothetical protein
VTLDLRALAALLPAVLRRRDAELGAGIRAGLDPDPGAGPDGATGRSAEDFGPLLSLLSVVAEQVRNLSDDLDQLSDDQFLETCADDVVPLLADLLGATPPHGVGARVEIARTIPLRRRKGTVAALESLAASTTGWPALAVEYFPRIAATQHVNRLRLAVPASADLRDGTGLAALGGPFDRVPHNVDVRHIGSGRGGRHNLPNVGVFLHRLLAAPRRDGTPFRLGPDDPRFLFHALGRDLPLFRRPAPPPELDARAGAEHLPTPITRRALHADPATLYGPDASLCVFVDGEPVPLSGVAVCNLADLPTDGPPDDADWQVGGPADRFRIDPERGRFVAPDGLDGAVTVRHHAGAVADLGGGEYPRAGVDLPTVHRAAGQPIADALAGLDGAGAVVLDTGETIAGAVALAPPAGATVALVAADGRRPVLDLPDDLVVDATPGSTTVLDGLLVAGGGVRVTASAPATVVIRDCTLVPGRAVHRDGSPTRPEAPSVVVDGDEVELRIERSVVGGIECSPATAVTITGSIVQAPAPAGHALRGGTLTANTTTLLGRVHVTALGEVTDCLVPGGGGDAPSVVVDRRQEGCVRFSFVPLDAALPRRFRCLPQTTAQARDLRPVFTSVRWDDPGYTQLAAATPLAVREGAADGSEPGAHHDLQQRARIADLRVRLGEFVPVAAEAGILLES